MPEGIPRAESDVATAAGIPGYGTNPALATAIRRQRDYDPLGIRIGGFLVSPTLSEELGYDTNPGGQPNPVGSPVVTTEAAVLAKSNWNRDALAFYGSVDDHRYPQQSQQSATNWRLAAGGAYDIGRDQVTGSVLHVNGNITPRDLNIPDIAEPEPYTVDDFRLGYRAELSRIKLIPTIDFARWRYANLVQNGVPIVLDYQNRNVAAANLTTSYELSTLRHLLLVVRAVDTRYVQPIAGAPNRDSIGPDVLVGLNYGTGGLWRYRALIGYQVRTYTNSSFRPAGVVTAEGDVTWMPTGLTAVTANFLRTYAENPASIDTVGSTLTHASFAVEHEYSHNVSFRVHAEADQVAYPQGGGQAAIFNTGLKMTWFINRNMRASVSYDYRDRRSGSTSFTENVALGQLRLAF